MQLHVSLCSSDATEELDYLQALCGSDATEELHCRPTLCGDVTLSADCDMTGDPPWSNGGCSSDKAKAGQGMVIF